MCELVWALLGKVLKKSWLRINYPLYSLYTVHDNRLTHGALRGGWGRGPRAARRRGRTSHPGRPLCHLSHYIRRHSSLLNIPHTRTARHTLYFITDHTLAFVDRAPTTRDQPRGCGPLLFLSLGVFGSDHMSLFLLSSQSLIMSSSSRLS